MKAHGHIKEDLNNYLKRMQLSTVRRRYEEVSQKAQAESMTYEQYLWELINEEYQERRCRRIERLLKESHLPMDKTMSTFDMKRMPRKIAQQAKVLQEGEFLSRNENILAFGNPGSGKTHLLCAIGHELVYREHRVYYTMCANLVQELLLAKRELRLPAMLKKLSKYKPIIIDDIGYIPQGQEEMEVLFTFLADRYERGSVMITSNLPFSKWEKIFKDPMTTAAAIDRLIHHSVILEINLASYRMEQAKDLKNNG
jgi:DNA replication protein DnaC